MAEVEIKSGACGFKTTVNAESADKRQAKLKVESECPHVMKMMAEMEDLDKIDVMNELFKKDESKIMKVSKEKLPHVTCPVASGILKTLEASAGLALPKDVTITFKK